MNLVESFRINERWTSIASHILAVGLLAFVAAGLVRLGGFLVPLWNPAGVQLMATLVAVEALVSYRTAIRLPAYDWNGVLFRAVEWIVLASLIKLFTELRFGWGYFVDNLSRWPHNFVEAFFTSDYFLTLALSLIVWFAATLFAHDLTDLEGDVELLRNADHPVDRRSAHREITGRFLGLGLLLVVVAGVMRQGRIPLGGRSPVPSADVLFVVWYFLLGLVLVGLTNFASLRATWSIERVRLPASLAPRWIFSSLVFVGVLAGLALLLPTRYSLGFLAVLSYLIGLLVFFIELVFAAFTAVIFFLGSLLTTIIKFLFGDFRHENNKLDPSRFFQTVVPPAPVQVNSPSWWETAKSVLFWVVLALVVVFAFSQYLKRNRALAQSLGRFKPWRWLAAFRDWLMAGFRKTGRGLRTALEAGAQKLKARRSLRNPRVQRKAANFRKLDPRQRVLFYYLALVRRAEESGLPRQPWMTPREYSRALSRELSEVGENVTALTEAFMQARYTRQAVDAAFAGQAKEAWERLRSALRQRRAARKKE
jgi:hypothetical protein